MTHDFILDIIPYRYIFFDLISLNNIIMHEQIVVSSHDVHFPPHNVKPTISSTVSFWERGSMPSHSTSFRQIEVPNLMMGLQGFTWLFPQPFPHRFLKHCGRKKILVTWRLLNCVWLVFPYGGFLLTTATTTSTCICLYLSSDVYWKTHGILEIRSLSYLSL